MRYRGLILAMVLHFFSLGFSQETERKVILESIQNEIETKDQRVLQGIRSLIEREENYKAKERLGNYIKTHPKDPQITWLYAYVLHINRNYKLSRETYRKAMSLAPKNNSIKMDYARVLYEKGQFKKAVTVLEGLRNLDDNLKAEGLIMLAKISYWQGNIDKCKRIIRNFRSEFPGSDKLDELSVEMSNATAIYAKASYEMQTDSQPLDYSAIKAEAGMYKSKFFSPKVEVASYTYTPTASAMVLKVSNQFYFSSIGLSATANLGTFSNDGGSASLFGVTLNKKLPYRTSVTLGYNVNPVLGTIASTVKNVTNTTISGGIDYSNKIFSTNLEYNQQNFTVEGTEDNTIKNYVFWIISQPIKISKLEFQIGYSYGYSDSEKVFYIADAAVFSEPETAEEGEEVEEPQLLSYEKIYDPYFTPKGLESNSLLLVANYEIFDFLEVGGKTNYGIEAKAINPIIEESSITVLNPKGDLYLPTEKTLFYPSESSLYVKYFVNSQFTIKATYLYQETFFYDRSNISLEAKYRF